MNRKKFLLTLSIITSIATLGCVAPYYGTARIEPGWDVNAGLAYSSGIPGWSSYVMGARLDLYAGYGMNKYLKPYARAAAGVGYEWYSGSREIENGYLPIFDIGCGLQTCIPLGPITPALALEISPYYGFSMSPIVLLGFGKREFLTLGVKPHFITGLVSDFVPVDVFISVHPIERLSVFAGCEVNSIIDSEPWITAGVGYRLSK